MERNWLFKIFQRNVYPRNFIRITANEMNKKTKERANCSKKLLVPYFEIYQKRLQDRLERNALQQPTNPPKLWEDSHRTPKKNSKLNNRRNIIYKVKCREYDKFCMGLTERKRATWMHEHRFARERHGPLSLISLKEDPERHTFNLDTIYIVE